MLSFIPIAEITSRADRFECTAYSGNGAPPVISAGCCAKRRALVRRGARALDFALCTDACAEGNVVERLSGGPVTLGKHAGSDAASRKRGGVAGPKALAAKRRLAMADGS